jgi:uncharacterized protein
LILKQGARVNERDASGGTALAGAVIVQDVETVRLLLQNGANVHLQPDGPEGILELARLYGNREIVRFLLQAGVRPIDKAAIAHKRLRQLTDINAPNADGITPLMQAIIERNGPLVTMLLSRGADIHRRDKVGRTALWFAANNGDLLLAQTLLQRGADINATGTEGSPLVGAVWSGKVPIIRFLLEHGADPRVDERSQSGSKQTALSIARRATRTSSPRTNQKFEQIVRLLTKAGATQ